MTSLTTSPTKTENELDDADTSTLNSTISNASTLTNNTSYPDPIYTSTNMPSATDFHLLDVTNEKFVNIVLSPSSDSNLPVIYVSNYIWAFGKYSVTLHIGSKTGRILGVLKIAPFSSENSVGLGDPNADESRGIVWKSLDRTSKWTHSTYEFEWGERRFAWQRTRMPVFSDQPDLELREKVKNDVGGEENGYVRAGAEEVKGKGQVLAVYKGIQGWFTGQRGTFWVRKGDTGFEDKSKDKEGGGHEEEWSDWETMVLLTGCGVIEACRRRTRQRRGGGGGGG